MEVYADVKEKAPLDANYIDSNYWKSNMFGEDTVEMLMAQEGMDLEWGYLTPQQNILVWLIVTLTK